jgi:two-component system, OmpR family, alkaline phosphatase synthesis response regulator PhoP
MAKEKIMVVEDEEDILELISYNLQKEGYRVIAALSGELALKKIKAEKPDLLLLDLMLPGVDGLAVCKEVKSSPETKDIPVVMLTAKGEEVDVVTGLEVGADDYITKPFSPRILLARIRAMLRRKKRAAEHAEDKSVVSLGGIELDPLRHKVLVKGKPVELTFTEFAILDIFLRRPGIVFERYQIVDLVKGEDYPVTDRSVDVHIVGLRKKLGNIGDRIETIRGIGYRFRSDD